MDVKTCHFSASDGVQIAVHEMGAEDNDARAVILIHGYFSDAAINWIKYGHATVLAEAGYHVIMPDLRAHGQSGKPHGADAYPPDILVDDQFALIDHLGLTEFDLGGYSLGGRTVARMLARGCRPRRAIISGMGLQGLTGASARTAHFRNVFDNAGKHERGSPAFMAEAFLKTTGGDAVALRLLLDSFVDTPLETIKGLDSPVAVICGAEDQDNGSATDLAAALPHGRYIETPGNHMSAVVKPELGAAICEFLELP